VAIRSILRLFLPLAAVCALGLTDAHAQAEVLINTTAYVFPIESFHCVSPTQPCSLNAAIERGQSSFGATVTACFDEGDPRCLQTSDPNYDPDTGKWHLKSSEPFDPYVIDRDDMVMDFRIHVDGWASPADNKIVLDFETNVKPRELFLISGNGNQFAGMDIAGSAESSHLVVRADSASAVASDNVFGPGLVLSGLDSGVAIRVRGAGVQRTKIIGNWCGVRGDGTEVAPNSEHCIEVLEGANGTIIGGPDPADRNVFAGNLDSAIQVADASTRDTIIEGNYIGMDATGLTPAGNATGISLVREAQATKIFANVISGNTVDGVLADNTSTEFGRLITRIEDNYIGPDASGLRGPGNAGCGIQIRGLAKNVYAKNNRIWFNDGCGVQVTGANARDNTITRNSISQNQGRAIQVGEGANENVAEPVIAVAKPDRINVTACPFCVVEVFTDPIDEAEAFEGETTADADGTWQLVSPSGFTYRFVTATATDGKNTSGLSQAMLVERGQLPTRTPTIHVGATATRTPEVIWIGIHLPWTGNKESP
jgi:hypothetical protein